MTVISALQDFLDIIYPPRCQFCHDFLWCGGLPEERQGVPVCPSCLRELKEVSSPVCTLCGRPFHSGLGQDHMCEACIRRRPFFDGAGAPYLYEGIMMSALHRFKYEGKSVMVKSLGPLLAAFAGTWLTKKEDLLLIPVPLHSKRLRERGFNQSLLLSRHVSSYLKCQMDFLNLRRARNTLPQAGLQSSERRKNVQRAFHVLDPKSVKGRTIALIDDVVTTGNTLNECARVLKRAGARRVYGLVLARTVMTSH